MAGNGKNLIFAARASSEDGTSYQEALASVDILPGTAVLLNGSGEFAKAGAGSVGIRIADINATKQLTVEEGWVSSETMVAIVPRVAQKFNVRIASGQNLVKGTPLKVAANGQFTVATLPTDVAIVEYYSDEVVSSTTADQLVRVERA